MFRRLFSDVDEYDAPDREKSKPENSDCPTI